MMNEFVGNQANRPQVHVSNARQALFFDTYHDTTSYMQHMQAMVCADLCTIATLCKQTHAMLP